jgi:UDP-N-acetylglucosamine transferase subunit ALG13
MKRVLVTPLDWGLGHATRCIPIIKKLFEKKVDVLIAGSGDSLNLLRAEFPFIKSFVLPGYAPSYPANGSMALTMLKQTPKFFSTIKSEHGIIEKIVADEEIDFVISDNRYGCWSEQVHSIFITHQSNIMMPKRFGWLSGVVRSINHRYMKKFSLCWIPDIAGQQNLSGKLSSFGKIQPGLNVKYIGALSRFVPSDSGVPIKYDITAIFSGPEPQRTILENMVTPQLQSSGLKFFIVRGVISSEMSVDDTKADFLTSKELQNKIESSSIIVARAGYSTIMDMSTLGKKAIFIPTPGQTEQEYLAKQLLNKGIAFSMTQENFNLKVALQESKRFTGFTAGVKYGHALDLAIDDLLLK